MRRFVMIVVLAFLAGCVAPPTPPPPLMSGPEMDYQKAELLVRDKKYGDAIALYRKIAADAPQSSVAGDAFFGIAYLLAYYDNPQKDYAQALQGLDDFLKRYPDHARVADAQNWRVVLRLILDTKKENDRLNNSIEQLKKLDIRHEERRRR